MYHKTIFHTLPDGTKAKFTIRDRIIDGEVFFYANVVGTEIDCYTSKTDLQKESFYGTEITNRKQQAINYRDCNKLINGILTKYGFEGLDTEK